MSLSTLYRSYHDWVVGRAEETSTYSSLGFCSVNCRPTASNYQLSHLRPCRGSNPGLRGGRRECYHSATVAPQLPSSRTFLFDHVFAIPDPSGPNSSSKVLFSWSSNFYQHFASTQEPNYQLREIYVYFYFIYYHNYYVICTLYVNSIEESEGVTQTNYSPKSTQALVRTPQDN